MNLVPMFTDVIIFLIQESAIEFIPFEVVLFVTSIVFLEMRLLF